MYVLLVPLFYRWGVYYWERLTTLLYIHRASKGGSKDSNLDSQILDGAWSEQEVEVRGTGEIICIDISGPSTWH